MKTLRVFSVLAVFALIAISTSPVIAKDKGPKDPNFQVARVETFEVVKDISVQEYVAINPEAANVAAAASGCKGYTLGRKGYSGIGVHIWTYSWTINWCYNGSTITSLSKYPTVWANYYWRFVRHAGESQSGGVGQVSYSHYAQGEFCYIPSANCLSYSYPWVNQTVKGNGTYSGTAGGD
ncbi:MAG: hypothetical protein ABIU06_03915 [Anaerolineales bacterium]